MLRRRFQQFGLVCVLHALFSVTVAAEGVRYENPRDLAVEGSWFETAEQFRVFPAEMEMDIDHNGVADLRLRHNLVPRLRRVDYEAVRMLETAEAAIAESLDLVLGFRRIAIDAANEGVNDSDRLYQLQSQVENGIWTMQRIASWPYQGSPLLDGSRGKQVVSSSDRIVAINATEQTQPGSYAIDVATAGERAAVSARTSQTAALFADETLVVNQIAVELNQGMTQTQVVDRINDFSRHTGVLADIGGLSGSTRLYAENFGEEATIKVVSNTFASEGSTGFGHAAQSAIGASVVAMVGPHAYTGAGSTVTATGGSERGLTFRVLPDYTDPTVTVSGAQGVITVTDQSPRFVVDRVSGESLSLSIPNIQPSVLGLGILDNQFASLEEIKISSASQANDSLAVIDRAIDELVAFHRDQSDFLAYNAYPVGEGLLEGINGAEYSVGEFGLHPAGIEVGHRLDFSSDSLVLQDSSVLTDQVQSGFIGVRMPIAEGWAYGWVGVEMNGDSSYSVMDYAWNTEPNDAVTTGQAARPVLQWPRPGDTNRDGSVDFADFLTLTSNFQHAGEWSDGDFNGDALIDFGDFLLLSANFGKHAVAVSVPESASTHLLLMTLGLALLASRGRRHGIV